MTTNSHACFLDSRWYVKLNGIRFHVITAHAVAPVSILTDDDRVAWYVNVNNNYWSCISWNDAIEFYYQKVNKLHHVKYTLSTSH